MTQFRKSKPMWALSSLAMFSFQGAQANPVPPPPPPRVVHETVCHTGQQTASREDLKRGQNCRLEYYCYFENGRQVCTYIKVCDWLPEVKAPPTPMEAPAYAKATLGDFIVVIPQGLTFDEWKAGLENPS